MRDLKTKATIIKNALFGLFIIWQMVQITGYLNPFRGWQSPYPQLIASALIFTYFPVKYLIRRVPQYKLKQGLIAAVPFAIVFFLLSMNIALGFNPGRWFMEPNDTLGRLQLTFAFYSVFVMLLAVIIALLNGLKPGE